MKISKKSIALLLLTFLLPFILGYASIKKKTTEAWFTYWDAKNSLENLKNNFQGKIDRVNLFFYALDKDANIVNVYPDPDEYKQIIGALHQLNVKILPSITNDIIYSKTNRILKDPEIIHRILNDEELRKRHLLQIAEIVKEINADGVDIDYERIYIEDKHAFTKFIKELSAMLHSENKTLAVTALQKTKDHQKSGAGAIDWKEISKYADKITIMCYNYSSKVSKPGPIAPPFWLKDIIKFAKSQIPPEKICIALALHGYDWSKEEVIPLNFRKVVDLVKEHSPKLTWNRKSQTPYFTYSKDGIKHQVWFENQKSITNKIQLIKQNKINHIAFWHLGIMDPSLSESIESFLE